VEQLERDVAGLKLEWVEQLDRLHRIARRLTRGPNLPTPDEGNGDEAAASAPALTGVAAARERRKAMQRALRERFALPAG